MTRVPALRCLHGFLGLPADFDFVGGALAGRGLSCRVSADELWPHASLPLASWVDRALARWPAGEVLLGYSMGGRLALQAFLDPRSRAAALVVVSSDPGGCTGPARYARLGEDEAWARRFEHEAWDPLLAAWNRRSVFGRESDARSVRREQDFERDRLAAALRNWSVGRQPDLWAALGREQRPLLWVAGERDEKYVGIARRAAALNPRVRLAIVPRAGHRVPWEGRTAFADALRDFLGSSSLWGRLSSPAEEKS